MSDEQECALVKSSHFSWHWQRAGNSWWANNQFFPFRKLCAPCPDTLCLCTLDKHNNLPWCKNYEIKHRNTKKTTSLLNFSCSYYLWITYDYPLKSSSFMETVCTNCENKWGLSLKCNLMISMFQYSFQNICLLNLYFYYVLICAVLFSQLWKLQRFQL